MISNSSYFCGGNDGISIKKANIAVNLSDRHIHVSEIIRAGMPLRSILCFDLQKYD